MVDQKIALDNCTEAVCIDASRIYDSCCDKDCLEDMKVYFTDCVQPLIDQAINVKVRSAEVINVITDVEPVAFNRGFFSVDITFFFLVKCYIYTAPMAPAVPVTGLAIFNKKCILFGSEGSVKVFGSEYRYDADDEQLARAKNTPRATVQVVEPIVLAARINEECDCCCEPCCCVPKCVCKCFEGNFGNVNGNSGNTWSILDRSAVAQCADADSGIRFLRAGEGVQLQRKHREPLRPLQENQVPERRVFPAAGMRPGRRRLRLQLRL